MTAVKSRSSMKHSAIFFVLLFAIQSEAVTFKGSLTQLRYTRQFDTQVKAVKSRGASVKAQNMRMTISATNLSPPLNFVNPLMPVETIIQGVLARHNAMTINNIGINGITTLGYSHALILSVFLQTGQGINALPGQGVTTLLLPELFGLMPLTLVQVLQAQSEQVQGAVAGEDSEAVLIEVTVPVSPTAPASPFTLVYQGNGVDMTFTLYQGHGLAVVTAQVPIAEVVYGDQQNIPKIFVGSGPEFDASKKINNPEKDQNKEGSHNGGSYTSGSSSTGTSSSDAGESSQKKKAMPVNILNILNIFSRHSQNAAEAESMDGFLKHQMSSDFFMDNFRAL